MPPDSHSFTAPPAPRRERRKEARPGELLDAAHTAAAQCLESGKDAQQCMKELQAACKNLAIGKYCGMKHAH